MLIGDLNTIKTEHADCGADMQKEDLQKMVRDATTIDVCSALSVANFMPHDCL